MKASLFFEIFSFFSMKAHPFCSNFQHNIEQQDDEKQNNHKSDWKPDVCK